MDTRSRHWIWREGPTVEFGCLESETWSFREADMQTVSIPFPSFYFFIYFFFFLVLSFPWTKMMTYKLDNFNEYEGQKPKLTHFTTFPELHWFVKHSYLKDINSQRNIFYFLLSLIFLFFDRIPLYWCKARQTAF